MNVLEWREFSDGVHADGACRSYLIAPSEAHEHWQLWAAVPGDAYTLVAFDAGLAALALHAEQVEAEHVRAEQHRQSRRDTLRAERDEFLNAPVVSA